VYLSSSGRQSAYFFSFGNPSYILIITLNNLPQTANNVILQFTGDITITDTNMNNLEMAVTLVTAVKSETAQALVMAASDIYNQSVVMAQESVMV